MTVESLYDSKDFIIIISIITQVSKLGPQQWNNLHKLPQPTNDWARQKLRLQNCSPFVIEAVD